MDEIDRKILRKLIENGRIKNAQLSRDVGLSESATLERVRRLETAGLIEGYSVQLDPAKMGRGLEVVMNFTLENQGPADIERFSGAIREMDEVLSCAQVLGRHDFIAHVAVADVASLHRFISEKLIGLKLIQRMESLTVLKTIKRYRPPAPSEGEQS